jgi:hypothetical protein
MMLKKLNLFLAVTSIALFSVDAHAQRLTTEIAIKPSFFTASSALLLNNHEVSLQNDLNINKSQTLCELYGALSLDRFSIKGSYIFPRSTTSDGLLAKEIINTKLKEETVLTTSSYSVSIARVEFSTPVAINRYTLIEPLIAYQTASQKLNITAQDFNYTQTFTNNDIGLGAEITELLSQYTRLTAKLAFTQNTSILNLKYKYYDRLGYFSAGYDWININNPNIKTRLHGPTLEIGVRF